MNIRDRMIMTEYKKQRPHFIQLGNIVHDILSDIAGDSGVLVAGIEHRVKAEKSLEGKLFRNADYYQKLEDLTDILGARMICYFHDDVDVLGKYVEENFVIDWENSSDKRAILKADSFGYLSLHYICSLPENAGYPPEVCGKKFEIQIRTILQHAWSAINHDLGYKSEFGAPRHVVREFARLAGLLELADEEFSRTRDHMQEYTEEVRDKIINDKADNVNIDLVSLNEYVLHNHKLNAFMNRLALIEGSEVSEINPESYIVQLRWLGIDTIGKLQKMLERNEELAYSLAEKTLKGSELDILSSNAALRFLCRAELVNGGYTADQIKEFLNITTRNENRSESQAKRLLSMAESLKK